MTEIPCDIKNVTDAHFKWADLYLKALDFVIRHDIRPSTGEFANKTTLDARKNAAVSLLTEAMSTKITTSS